MCRLTTGRYQNQSQYKVWSKSSMPILTNSIFAESDEAGAEWRMQGTGVNEREHDGMLLG